MNSFDRDAVVWGVQEVIWALDQAGERAKAIDGFNHLCIKGSKLPIEFWPSEGRWKSPLGEGSGTINDFRIFIQYEFPRVMAKVPDYIDGLTT